MNDLNTFEVDLKLIVEELERDGYVDRYESITMCDELNQADYLECLERVRDEMYLIEWDIDHYITDEEF